MLVMIAIFVGMVYLYEIAGQYSKRRGWHEKKAIAREWVESIITALILALFVRTFIVQAYKIPSESMKNTLLAGDHILVNKFIYGISIPFTDVKLFAKSPEHNDIIVFRYPKDESRDFIKRVIGVAEDTIEVKNQTVYVNGSMLYEAYTIHNRTVLPPPYNYPRDDFGPVRVPENKLFVMGDNRENSQDSRFWGFVDISKVRGEAFIIYWSWNKKRYAVRWNRLGMIIQ